MIFIIFLVMIIIIIIVIKFSNIYLLNFNVQQSSLGIFPVSDYE